MTDLLDPLSDTTARVCAPDGQSDGYPSTAGDSLSGAAAVATVLAAALLAGCGGGGGGGSSSPTPVQPSGSPPPPPMVLPTQSQAARFLAQAGFAASSADMGTVTAQGYSAWLDTQFSMAPSAPSAYDWNNTQSGLNTAYSNSPGDFSVWRRLISSPDALRQRAVLALSEIFVISLPQLNAYYRSVIPNQTGLNRLKADFLLHRGRFRLEPAPKARAFLSTG